MILKYLGGWELIFAVEKKVGKMAFVGKGINFHGLANFQSNVLNFFSEESIFVVLTL